MAGPLFAFGGERKEKRKKRKRNKRKQERKKREQDDDNNNKVRREKTHTHTDQGAFFLRATSNDTNTGPHRTMEISHLCSLESLEIFIRFLIELCEFLHQVGADVRVHFLHSLRNLQRVLRNSEIKRKKQDSSSRYHVGGVVVVEWWSGAGRQSMNERSQHYSCALRIISI